jgi:serpin B
MRSRTITALAVGVVLVAAACGDTGGGSTTTTGDDPTTTTTADENTTTTRAGDEAMSFIASGLDRRPSGAVDDDVMTAAAGLRAFADQAYARIAEANDGNLVYSPASIHLALAMTYAGARGETATEMREALHFDLDGVAFHQAMNTLDQVLAGRNREEPPGPDDIERKVRLQVANALWGQQGFEFEQEFLDTLAADYGAGMNLVDFVAATEEARRAINAWVSEQTNDRIPELIPSGVLSAMTRLVLTNAVYLDATWARPFDANETWEAPFARLDGSEVSVETMHQQLMAGYAAGDGWQAIELPYVGEELAMMFLVPDTGAFADVEESVSDGLFDEVLASLEPADVDLSLPKYEFRFKASVAQLLRDLGMPMAFDPSVADFSGMTTADRLFISDVIHEAFIAVDEEGTEAAAATAVVMDLAAAPIEGINLQIDRPFLFSLYDRETGAVLFMGRVLDPAA